VDRTVVTFAGRYYQLQDAWCDPRPFQKPYPPFVIGGTGEQTLRVVARYADVWDWSVDSPEEYQHKSSLLDAYCATIGRDPATIDRPRHISVDLSDLATTRQKTLPFIEAGATHIIYSVPPPYPANIVARLAEEVAEPLQAAYGVAPNPPGAEENR
jgi:alkanesulfonate monooxygenase SsuD/methylene tetrahydromethanopterin reductase-like flavin-dependent oxidoreductase (luciferase family)